MLQVTDQLKVSDQELFLQVAPNDPCFTVAVNAPVNLNQGSVQTILLNDGSTVAIGSVPVTADDEQNAHLQFNVPTTPTVVIDGAFFSFETLGSLTKLSDTGAILVGQNGVFTNNDGNRANISTMVVRSGNGVVDLPVTDISFASRVGVTDFKPVLKENNILVQPGETFSDFTLDWSQVSADCTSFVPFDPKMTPLPCQCPPLTNANLTNLPTILGTVEQLQIRGSRLGDQVNVLVGAGGLVRELVFLPGCPPAQNPMGLIAVEGWGQVGLGSAHRNLDSNFAALTLGINGVTVVAKGDGVIELNENIIIDNVCHIMPGPDFGQSGTQTLTFFSNDACEFRIKSTGVLDLSQFKGSQQQVTFGGNMRLVFEPGAQMLLSNVSGDDNRTNVVFTDTVSINFERVFDTAVLAGTAPNAVANRLVKFSGNGNVVMNKGATLILPDNTFLGIETNPDCGNFTDIQWTLNDQASFNVGTETEQGGSFQVGNRTNVEGSSINFELVVDGVNAVFQIRRQGLVSFGVGAVSTASQIPNQWTFEGLNNVNNVAITLLAGSFRHNQIFSGDTSNASLLVVGPAASYDFSFDVNQSLILGGGNLALVATNPIINPIFGLPVTNVNSSVTGLMSSKDILRDGGVFPFPPLVGLQTVSGLTPTALFNYLQIQTVAVYHASKAAIAYNLVTQPTIAYVVNSAINRFPIVTLLSVHLVDSPTGYTRSVNRGAVNLRTINNVFVSVSEYRAQLSLRSLLGISRDYKVVS